MKKSLLLDTKLSRSELEELCEGQTKLAELQAELKSLQRQQSQVQVPPKK